MEDALNDFLNILWAFLVKHIPRTQIRITSSSHPWLNSRARAAIIRKNNSEGSDDFAEASEECSRILCEERNAYIEVLKAKLVSPPRSSKQWWRINRELLHRKGNAGSIFPLRDGITWLTDARGKADAFAKTFASKDQLPPELVDTPFFGLPIAEYDEFIPLRTRCAHRLLGTLDASKATGPDQISAAILKNIAAVLAMPFTQVCTRLLHEPWWPKIWKLHVVVPTFKRGSACNPGNYRGVHLTRVLSKVAERMIGSRLVPMLQQNAFGPDQLAFSRGLGAKDLITMLVMTFNLAVYSGQKIGGYLSGITSAFDRVLKCYLLAKFLASGVGSTYLNILDAYLDPRKGKIVVLGTASEEFVLEDSVFQGTVLGPPLWNAFFADVSVPAAMPNANVAKFADDLNAFKQFDKATPLENVTEELSRCRSRVHALGRAHRVAFDVSKEPIVVLHPTAHHGEPFKLLGCMMDLNLRMHTVIDQILDRIQPK